MWPDELVGLGRILKGWGRGVLTTAVSGSSLNSRFAEQK